MTRAFCPDGIPAMARENFERLLAAPVPSLQELLHVLEGHSRVLELAAQGERSLMYVRQITDRCRALLEHWPALWPDARRAVAAAIRYYALRDDAIDDIGSEEGLVDDALVVNAVVAHLRLALPAIEVPAAYSNPPGTGPGIPTQRG